MSHSRPTLSRAALRVRHVLPVLAATLASVAVVAGLAGPSVPLAAAATTSAYASSVLADAPAGYWRLGEASGTTAADATGAQAGAYRYGVTLAQAALPPTETDRSIGLDGFDDDVRVPSTAALSPTASVSVEAWIRPAALPASGAFASLATKAESYALQFNGPRLEFTIMQSGTRRRLQAASGAIVVGTTYHVVGTYDGATQRLYVNGTQVASAALSGAITANANPLTIGSWNGSKERFKGRIDEVAVYRGALSAARVAAHRSAGMTAPTVTPAPTATPAPSATPTATPAPTPAPTATPVPTAIPSPTPAPTVTPTPTPTPTATPAPASAVRTGMAAHFMWQNVSDTIADLDRMQAAHMTYVRFDVSWRNMEPAKGTYQYFDKLDQVISAVRSHGMALTITVIETPSWANGGKGMFAPPADMADYASFMAVLAKRYAATPGMVWEIWNEENDPNFWTTGPSATQYASMLKAAYAAVKANDPDATVITGGILYNNTAFLEGLYSAGAGTSFDGLGIHPYCKGYAPSATSDAYFSFAGSVPQFTNVLSAHGQGTKPIWITEMGWSTDVVTDATRATYLRDAVGIARTWTNVRGMGAYTLHQSQFAQYGLLTTTGTATASWTAYAAAQ